MITKSLFIRLDGFLKIKYLYRYRFCFSLKNPVDWYAVHKYESNYVKLHSVCCCHLCDSLFRRVVLMALRPSADDDEANRASDEPVVVLQPYI